MVLQIESAYSITTLKCLADRVAIDCTNFWLYDFAPDWYIISRTSLPGLLPPKWGLFFIQIRVDEESYSGIIGTQSTTKV